MTGEKGTRLLLDLDRAQALRGGDGLELEDGRIVEVVAAPEELLEVRAQDPHALLRLAWHLGNRHLPTQVFADRLLIRRDRVIADMLKGLGAELREVAQPFDPEGGAYGGHGPSHDHAHDGHGHAAHDHDHHDHARGRHRHG